MTNHEPRSRSLWRRVVLVAAAALVGACGEGPGSTTITGGGEGAAPTGTVTADADDGSSEELRPGEPETQTGEQAPGEPGGEAPAGPGGGQGPGSGETGGDPGPDEPDGPAAPVDDTGAGDDAAGPTTAPGEDGMFWWKPESKWATVIDEVLDMCDDSEAVLAVTGRRPSPGGDDITNDPTWIELTLNEIAMFKTSRGVSCAEPGGLRYVVITRNGPGPPGVSPQDAVTQLRIGRENSPHYGEVTGPPGHLLGYHGFYYHVYEPVDEVRVRADTVTVVDSTIRGMVQNLSDNLWARDVTVAVGDKKWVWPLTVQPGEVAPFEIENWTGATDPAAIDLQVTATLSTTIDISRALQFTSIIDDFMGTWEQYQQDPNMYPAFAVPDPPDGEFNYFEAIMDIEAPTSHPSLANQILNQTITGLTAYVAFIQDLHSERVTDVMSASTYYFKIGPGTTLTLELVSQLPDSDGYYNFRIGFHNKGYPHIWVGQAN